MPSFSDQSRERLKQCDPALQRIFNVVIKEYDCSILEGHRNEWHQNEYYRLGRSKVQWPNGKHNSMPSRAVDVVRWPIDWQDTIGHYHFAGYVMGIARMMEIPLRWGGDWDGDLDFKDNRFDDLVHFELLED